MRVPLLVVHISAGILGILSGFAAIFLRKGSRQHGVAGNVFFISMLSMSASAVYLAFMKHQINNVFGGILTSYLVATAWVTATRRWRNGHFRPECASGCVGARSDHRDLRRGSAH
jgi:uncharacterized membrane protein